MGIDCRNQSSCYLRVNQQRSYPPGATSSSCILALMKAKHLAKCIASGFWHDPHSPLPCCCSISLLSALATHTAAMTMGTSSCTMMWELWIALPIMLNHKMLCNPTPPQMHGQDRCGCRCHLYSLQNGDAVPFGTESVTPFYI